MTDKQELDSRECIFLDYLFDGEGMRHPNEAKILAGYPANYPILKIMKAVQQELIERMDSTATMYTPQAFMGLVELMNEPETPGNKLKLQVLLEILDRGGVVKKEKTEVAIQAPNFVFVLPSKVNIEQ